MKNDLLNKLKHYIHANLHLLKALGCKVHPKYPFLISTRYLLSEVANIWNGSSSAIRRAWRV